MFDRELAYFIAHQDELVTKYKGKTLVLRDESVTGVYDSPLQAYLTAEREYGLGKFMLQQCEPGPAAYTVTISSMNW